MAAPPEYFDPRGELGMRDRHLPHWRQPGVATFVTWRLADSLPAHVVAAWRHEQTTWLHQHPQPWSTTTAADYHELFTHRIDAWLDAGSGSCLLRAPELRSVVTATLLHRHGRDYVLHAAVVMPNHVHVVFSPSATVPWEKTVAAWKSVASHRINKRLQRHGALWQEESWDRLIRHEAHFAACCRYVCENPARARLRSDEYALLELG